MQSHTLYRHRYTDRSLPPPLTGPH